MQILFDWGNTLMADLSGNYGPMCDWPEVRAVPNARETLKRLSRSARCHVATNARDSDPEQIRKALARAGLESLIQEIFCYKTIGHAKPSLRFFATIARKLEASIEDLVMVGDDLENDVRGAIDAGMKAVWYNPDGIPGPVDIIQVKDLLELPDHIGRINDKHSKA